MNLDRVLAKDSFDLADLVYLLSLKTEEDKNRLFTAAFKTKLSEIGRVIHLRGLIELSNICQKNCSYCGIRKDNTNLKRYLLTDEEVLTAVKELDSYQLGSIVIQAGEREDDRFTDLVFELLQKIHAQTQGQLGVTLSLGEQEKEIYEQWQRAGAHRYLLRIETSNQALYEKIHDPDHSYERRMQCLYDLKELGYQLGTGVMIGLPGQSLEDLANDLLFFKKLNVDMVGMGPYLEHEETPLGNASGIPARQERFDLSLKMIACLRLLMKNINIAASTALETIHPQGRKLGLLAGANIIMPNFTPHSYRQEYCLYDGKMGLKENNLQLLNKLELMIKEIGCEIGYGQRGDSLHFKQPKI